MNIKINNKITFFLITLVLLTTNYSLKAKTLLDNSSSTSRECLNTYEPNKKELKEEITINNKKYNNIWQYNISENKEHFITLEQNNNLTQIKKYNLKTNKIETINEDKNIKYSPVINNKGNYAYVSYLNSNNNLSKIYLDGEEIDSVKNSVYLDINDKYLNVAVLNANNICKPYRFNIAKKTKEALNFPNDLQIVKFIRTSDNKFLLEGYSTKNNKTKVYTYNFENKSLKPINDKQEYWTEIIHEIATDSIIIDNISLFEGQIYTYLNLLSLSRSIKNSKMNNEKGTFTWNLGDRLEYLINFYSKYKLPTIKEHINTIAKNIFLKQNNKLGINTPFTYPEGWSAKAYSIDKKKDMNLLVDDAKIIYPLLLLYNHNLTSDKILKENILDTAIKTYDFYERDYKKGNYIFTKGNYQIYDGLQLPWNMQNAFGLCCIEFYKLTKDIKYKNRAIELAQSFKKEIIYYKDKIIWNYWPLKFHKGWKKEDKLSINTPQRRETPNILEDISHAGINVKFILEIQKNFPNEVFNKKDLELLGNTANSICKKNNGFYPTLFTDKHSKEPSYSIIPFYGWPETNSEIPMAIDDYISKGNLVSNDFEKTILYLVNRNNKKTLKITREKYDLKLNVVETITFTTTLEKYISDYCK